MQRLRTLLLVFAVCFSVISTPAFAQAPVGQADGQAYSVKSGDTLVKIATAFYGQAQAWRTILNATNAKAASDPSYAHLSDPNRIRPDQKLWIPSQPTSDAQVDLQALQVAYARAVKDAEVAESSEISRNLIAITQWEPTLIWQTDSGHARVLMVTWTNYNGYNDKVGQSTTLDATRMLWVTTAPEVRTFCRAYVQHNPSSDLDLRLRQLLGLPPTDQKTTMVEFWVDPNDLFRPAPDPEITDHEAELDFRHTSEVTTTSTYETWFNDLHKASYVAPGYPWTRLGYTYDWGNPNSEVGMSEFVIQGGATLEIAAVYPTLAYCSR